jgi:hypothetical protein
VKVLFEPMTTIPDSLTYDITAWGLPYAYGVDTYATPDRVPVDTASTPPIQPALTGNTNRPYAYVTPWRSRADARFAGALLQEDVRLRFVTKAFTIGDRTYAPGALIITRSGNANRLDNFDDRVRRVARDHEQPLHAIQTGFTDRGPDLGSGSVGFIDGPNVAVLSGPPLSSSSVGEVWHFFDQQIEYPATMLPADDFERAMLDDVNVLVLPDGRYGTWLSDRRAELITRWVREGGRLLVLGNANDALAERSGYRLTRKGTESESDTTTTTDLQQYGSQSQVALSRSTPGSIHRVRLDTSHPLGFGLASPYFTLKRNRDAFAYLETGWTVGALQDNAPVSGFIGHEAEQRIDDTTIFGTQRLGDGHVVYFVDNPLFRGFWYGGHVLFSNAVFFVGNN